MYERNFGQNDRVTTKTMQTSLTAHMYFDKILVSNEGGQFQENRFSYNVVHHIQMSRIVTKPPKWPVRLAKTQISLSA